MMKKILLLGATGNLGRVLLTKLLAKDYEVTALVRSPEKIRIANKNLSIIRGKAIDEKDLLNSLIGVDAVISVLGHGFRTRYPIQKNTMEKLIPLMEKEGVKRIITITGAGLRTREDPNSLILSLSDKLFSFIDPHRVSDAKDQQQLLERSSLEWTVVRTPVHNNSKQNKILYIGYNQPMPWKTVSRNAVAEFIIQCIEDKDWIRKSPIIY